MAEAGQVIVTKSHQQSLGYNLDLGFQSPELQENAFLWSELLSLCYFVMAAWLD